MSVVEGRADIKMCCVRSTSTGTRRVVRPSGWGVVNSLARRGCGPVGLVHTQKIGIQSEKPTWTKALEFTQFACPCGTDPRLLSGEQRTSRFKLLTSVDGPKRDIGEAASNECRHTGGRIAFQARPMREAGLFMPTEALPVTKWSLGILHGLVLWSGILDGPNRHPRILIPPDPRSGIPQILDLCSCILDGRTLQCF